MKNKIIKMDEFYNEMNNLIDEEINHLEKQNKFLKKLIEKNKTLIKEKNKKLDEIKNLI